MKRIGRPRLDGQPQGRRDGQLQADVLALLLESIPKSETLRWRDRVAQTFVGSPELESLDDDFWDCLRGVPCIPDAYVLNKDEQRIDFFEVELTSLMSDTKLQAYGRFMAELDYYGLNFSLFTVNQHGHINEVDLRPHYVAWLKAGMETQAA
jgi:hypothetical protein